MRPVLRLLGSRYGIALFLVVVVLAIVGVSRSFFGTRPLATVDAGSPATQNTVDPKAGYDGPAGADDVVTGGPSASGGASGGGTLPAGAPDPTPAATGFLRAWLAHSNVTPAQWYAGIAPQITPALAAKLKSTDPAGVPADRVTGALAVTARAADTVEVAAPVDSGTVRLRLVLQRGRWLVDGVDWDRA